jgi:S1-C subfamily serine protease
MKPRTRSLALVAALAAALVVGVGAGALAFAAFGDSGDTTVVRQVTVSGSQPTASGALTVGQVYDKTYRSVVEITVDSTSPSQFGEQQQQAQGSGFVYDENGDIVTNEHVVDGADSISVRFWNGATYKAKLVGSDASTDLAVIKVSAPSSLLTPLPLADSSKVAVGDPVIAIGSPFGLEGTVTSGIVSALHRAMEAPNNFTINDSIQTDAAINHGNSGGPLLNALGQVIGINAQIDSESGGSDGVGFAIPSDTVRDIASQLVQSGKVEHAYLGVQIVAIPSDVARQLGVPAGVEVTKVVSGTPADDAELRASSSQKSVDGQSYPTGGDVIVKFDGKTVTSSAQLQTLVDSKRPGDKVTVTYVRAGKTKSATVTLDTRPS